MKNRVTSILFFVFIAIFCIGCANQPTNSICQYSVAIIEDDTLNLANSNFSWDSTSFTIKFYGSAELTITIPVKEIFLGVHRVAVHYYNVIGFTDTSAVILINEISAELFSGGVSFKYAKPDGAYEYGLIDLQNISYERGRN